jgi:hypothetical protein
LAARVAVLLAEFRWLSLPVVRHPTLLDRLLLGPSVALRGRGDEARVDQLAGHLKVASLPEFPVELRKQAFDRARLGQGFAKGAGRVRIRHRIGQPEGTATFGAGEENETELTATPSGFPGFGFDIFVAKYGVRNNQDHCPDSVEIAREQPLAANDLDEVCGSGALWSASCTR